MLICSVQNKYQVWLKFSVKYDNAVGQLTTDILTPNFTCLSYVTCILTSAHKSKTKGTNWAYQDHNIQHEAINSFVITNPIVC